MKSFIYISASIPHHPCAEDFWLVCNVPISDSFLKVVCLYGTKCYSCWVHEWVSQSHINEHGAYPPPPPNLVVVSSFQVKAQNSCKGGFRLQILDLLMHRFGNWIKPNFSYMVACTELSSFSKSRISCLLLIFGKIGMSHWKKRTQQKGFISLKVFLMKT